MMSKPWISAVGRSALLRDGFAFWRIAFVLLMALGMAGRADGQNLIEAPWITGADFAGVDFPIEARPGDAVFQARGGWVWTDGDSQRLLLIGDVQVHIGIYDFVADRAAVWIEPRTDNGERIWQLAIYFDNVRTPLGSARLSQSASRLLVTAAIRGDVKLHTDLLQHEQPVGETLIAEGEIRLSRQLQTLLAQGAPVESASGLEGLGLVYEQPPLDPDAPIFPKQGVVTFAGPNRTFITGEDENSLVITGGVVVQFTDINAGRTLQITAQNAVVFLDPGSIADIVEAGPGDVHGVYLEGNVVATDGDFTVRGPRVFYDVQNDRAALLDAVFYTYDRNQGMPLYVRADIIRQEALGQWAAKNAKLSNVGFAEPHLSIGAATLQLTQQRQPDGSRTNLIDARGVSLLLGGKAVLPLPDYQGEYGQATLPQVRVGSKDGDAVISTRWDIESLFGLDLPDGFSGDVLIDAFPTRGPAGGLDMAWATPDAFGSILAYYIHDTGSDRLTSGADIEPTQKNRGLFLAEHQWRLDDTWTLSIEASYISDEAFVDAFFEPIAEIRREVTNRFALIRRKDRSLFVAQFQGTFNDFTPNEFLLQSRGYQVQRTPELSYWRLGDTFFDGKLSYTSESRVGLLSASFVEPPARNFGFVSPALSQAAFGINPGQSLGDALRGRGFTEDTIGRVDTRHELSAPMDLGPIRAVPFVAARGTLYSDDLSDFRAANGFTETDETRLWAAAGVNVSTSINRVYNNVESRLFDLHRIRQIFEPSASVWASTSSADSASFPVYDESVESLADGTAFRVGLVSTTQTQRGKPGAWRNVDWLVLRAQYVYATDSTTRESAIGRFFQSRPELSRFGQFADADAKLQLTDAIGVVGSGTYDTQNSTLDTASFGVLIDHGLGFTSFAEIRRIDADVLDSTFLNLGASFELSSRYAISAAGVYDIENSNIQSLGFDVLRRFPQWTLEFTIAFDDIRDTVSFGIRLRPFLGAGSRNRSSLSRERFSSNLLGSRYRGSLYQR